MKKIKDTYSIYIGDKFIATVEAGPATYACYEAAKTIAEYTHQRASLIDDFTGHEIASSDDYDEDDD